jgi:hypothetical protein
MPFAIPDAPPPPALIAETMAVVDAPIADTMAVVSETLEAEIAVTVAVPLLATAVLIAPADAVVAAAMDAAEDA